jgi:KWG repeat domain protein
MKYTLSFLLFFLFSLLHAQNEVWRDQYEQVDGFYDGLAAVRHHNRKWGFVNEKGTLVIPAEFDEVYSFDEGVSRVVSNGLYGLIDKKGKFIVPCQYKSIGVCLEGFLSVQDAETGKEGFIDKTGKIVVPIKYDSVDRFFDGMALVYKRNAGCGYVNTTGKEVIPLQYDNGWAFERGTVPVKKNNKWGFINKKNKPLTSFVYDDAQPFEEGFSVVTKDDKKGFVNPQGKEMVPLVYENAEKFSEGLAAVKKEGKWGYIDTTGKVVIPFAYSHAGGFEEGTAYVSIYETNFAIDKTGNCVSGCEQLEKDKAQKPQKGWQSRYEFVGETTDDFTVVGNGGLQGLVNKQGKEVIPTKFTEVAVVFNHAFVALDRKFGMFDLKGKEVIPVIYDSLIPKEMKDGGFILRATARDIFFSVLTKEGKVIVPENFYTYIEIEDYLEQGIIPVYREGKVGLYNLEGKELLPIKFDKIWPTHKEKAAVEVFYQGKSFYIDREGKCVEDCQNAPKE